MEEDEKRKTWAELTPEEKGALLLAHHEGKVIEEFDGGHWCNAVSFWTGKVAYRIRPEAELKMVRLFWADGCDARTDLQNYHTHVISFHTINDEPDPASIRIGRMLT
jgi:hypothetical protein